MGHQIASGVQEGVTAQIARRYTKYSALVIKVLRMRNWEIRRKTGPAKTGPAGPLATAMNMTVILLATFHTRSHIARYLSYP